MSRLCRDFGGARDERPDRRVECVTGRPFGSLRNREIRGALLAICSYEALPAHLDDQERAELHTRIYEEFLIVDGDYS
jgi:hypothetical protein